MALAGLLTNASLAAITLGYVVLTWKLAVSAEASAQFAREASAAAQAGLLIDFELIPIVTSDGHAHRLHQIVLVNVGNAAVYAHGVLLGSAIRLRDANAGASVMHEVVHLEGSIASDRSDCYLHPGESTIVQVDTLLPFRIDLVTGRVLYSLSLGGPRRERSVSEMAAIVRYSAWRTKDSGPSVDGSV